MKTLQQIRSDGEAEIALLLAQLDAKHKAILRDAIKQYGRVQNIPDSVWREIEDNTPTAIVKDRHGNDTTLAAAILLLLNSADEWTTLQMAAQGVSVNALSHHQFAGYSVDAARQAREIASETVATTRNRLSRKIEDEALSQNGELGSVTHDGIDAALNDVLNASRQATIATDATTGAISAGQTGAAGRAIGDDGFATAINGQKMTVALIWRTERDFLTCPRCAPLEGKTEEVWGLIFPEGPGDDAHPNCRCEIEVRAVPYVEPVEAA